MTKTIDIHIIDDILVELDENFFLSMTSGMSVHLSPFNRAEVIITNDDGKNLFLIFHMILYRNSFSSQMN